MNNHSEIQLTMNPPLMGFADFTKYTIKPIPNNPFFFSLQAKDGPSFILTKPEFFFSDFSLQGNHDWLENTDNDGSAPEVYIIVTVPPKPADMTANLLAPILVDQVAGRICQHIMYDSSYTTRHYLFPKEPDQEKSSPAESLPPEKRRHCG